MVNRTITPVVMQQTQQLNTSTLVLLIVFAIIISITLGVLAYIDYLKKKGKSEPKPDPALKSIMITFAVALLVIVAEIFGAVDRGFFKEHIWVLFITFIGAFMFYSWQIRRRDPMPPLKLIQIAERYVSKLSKGYEYIGDAYLDPLVLFRITQEGYSMNELRSSVMGILLRRDTLREQRTFFVQLNVFSGYPVHYEVNPSREVIDKLKQGAATTPHVESAEAYATSEQKNENET